MKTFRKILLLWIAAAFIAGCVTTGVKERSSGEKIAETIRPGGIHEDCMELFPGQSLQYSFEASLPVKFNIHFHEESGITYPVMRDNISSDRGVCGCEIRQYYCLMWTNPNKEPVNLIYEYNVIDKQK